MAKSNEAKASKGKTAKSSSAAKSAGGKGKAAAPAGPPRQPGVERRKNHPTRAKNGYFEVLLTSAVQHVGQPGDLVKVKPGFARNYLLPQGLATFATPHNLRIVSKHRERLRQLEEARRAELQNLAAQIAQHKIFIQAKANEEGQLYGSVNEAQIAEALRKDNFTSIEESNVRLTGHIKFLGNYKVSLHLGQEINTEIELWVMPDDAEAEKG